MARGAEPGKPQVLLIVVNVSWYFISHRLSLALAARDAGYEVHVAAGAEGDISVFERLGIPFHPLSLNRSGSNPLVEARVLTELYSLYRRIRPSLVHHVTIKPVVYGSIIARMLRVPGIVNAMPGLGSVFIDQALTGRVRGTLLRWMYRATLPKRGKVILQNRDDLELLVTRKTVRRESAVLIRGAGVDTQRITYSPEKPQSPPVVAMAARVLRDKGVYEFCAAAKLVNASEPVARFVLVGGLDAHNPSRLTKDEMQELVSESNIEWLGHRDDVVDIFEECAVACLPSYREGLPKVLLEAAAVGRPLVATDVPGCREVVRQDWNGYLVPVRNAARLAEAINALLRDPQLRERFGRNSRSLVESELSLQRVIGATLAVYRDSLSRHHA